MVENAQQLPQNSWFLTPVTAPFSTQLTASGATVLPWEKGPGVRALWHKHSSLRQAEDKPREKQLAEKCCQALS